MLNGFVPVRAACSVWPRGRANPNGSKKPRRERRGSWTNYWWPGEGARRSLSYLFGFDRFRFNHHEFTHRTLVEEFDAAGDLCEERIVFAAADVEPGLHAGTALPNDDGAARNELSAKGLKP